MPALACSSESYIGSVCIVAFGFCPQGYAEANGQLLPISQNTALFSLLGNYYGGDGRSNFALPDLRGRTPVHVGQGPGLANWIELASQGGAETVTLTPSQLPGTTTSVTATDVVIDMAQDPHGAKDGGSAASVTASRVSVALTGANQPVSIRDPYLGMRYCIALQGYYPPRP
ncbi:phage tail protein [Allochromatium humboldtianum]|uniref:Phage tail protein n=2 Tax=Allochromatium humboldtianum TaxID=504901 RepID=A0A850RFC9_9GAMM|nr:phage tail protein [Allochromatium humboldtianum]